MYAQIKEFTVEFQEVFDEFSLYVFCFLLDVAWIGLMIDLGHLLTRGMG